MNSMTNRLTLSGIKLLSTLLAFAPATAFAYVGPGAGITMLGSLWGLIVAVVFIVFGLLILPLKIMRNRMKKNKAKAAIDEAETNKEAPVAPEEQRTEAD